MGRLDQGLGVIGLLAVSAMLAILLTTGIPILLAPDPVKLSDWLGFAGSVATAFVTLVAAAVAWRAVKPQIRAQREAMLLTVLMREVDRMEAAIPYLDACIDFLDDILLQGELMAENSLAGRGRIFITAMQARGLDVPQDTLRSQIADQLIRPALPLEEAKIVSFVSNLIASARDMNRLVTQSAPYEPTGNPDVEEMRKALFEYQLRKFAKELAEMKRAMIRMETRVDEYRAQLPLFRSRINSIVLKEIE
jgi:hypothetical protein